MSDDGLLYLCAAATIGFVMFCITHCERDNQQKNFELEKFKIEHQFEGQKGEQSVK